MEDDNVLDLFGLKKETKQTSEEDFYAAVSAIAQFIEKVDNDSNTEKPFPPKS